MARRLDHVEGRPSAEAGHNPSRHKIYVRLVLSPVAAVCRWSLPLLSRLLSAQPRSSGGKLTRTAGPPGPRTGSSAAELRITRVFSCVVHGFKARPSFMFAGCCWWRSLAIYGSSGTSRGHGSVMRRPGSQWDGAVERPSAFQAGHIPSRGGSCECYALSPVAGACRWSLLLLSPLLSTRRRPSCSKPTRTLQGMARVRSGQAPAWPLVSVRSVRRGSRVKRDFACTLAEAIPPVLVVLRAQSRLGLEGRTRTLGGPSPDLTSSVSGLLSNLAHVRQARSRAMPVAP
jgi:hypothetical protein